MSDPVRERLHKMTLLGQGDSGVARILKFLKDQSGYWFTSGQLNFIFGSGGGSHEQSASFVGLSWRRRIQELAEEGLVQRERVEEGKHKGQNKWRIA